MLRCVELIQLRVRGKARGNLESFDAVEEAVGQAEVEYVALIAILEPKTTTNTKVVITPEVEEDEGLEGGNGA